MYIYGHGVCYCEAKQSPLGQKLLSLSAPELQLLIRQHGSATGPSNLNRPPETKDAPADLTHGDQIIPRPKRSRHAPGHYKEVDDEDEDIEDNDDDEDDEDDEDYQLVDDDTDDDDEEGGDGDEDDQPRINFELRDKGVRRAMFAQSTEDQRSFDQDIIHVWQMVQFPSDKTWTVEDLKDDEVLYILPCPQDRHPDASWDPCRLPSCGTSYHLQ